MIYINNTGKQNQVWLPKPYDVVSGDCPDVEEAYESGYTSGYTDGINACSGSCEGIWEDGYDSGYTDGQESVDCTDYYLSGKTDGIAEQKAKLSSTTITENGTYTRPDGFSAVTVDVPSGETIHNQHKIFQINGENAGLWTSEVYTFMSGSTLLGNVTVRPESGYTGLEDVQIFMWLPADEAIEVGYQSGYTDGLNACSGGNEDLIANLQGDYYVIPEGTTHLRDYAFAYTCFSSITIPDSVTEIGTAAFSNNSCLTSITIPDSVQSVGNSAFWNCKGLLSATIGSGLTGLSDTMFSAARSLTGITIPSNITSIGSSTFGTCSGLTHMTFEGLVPPTLAKISGSTASLGSTGYTFPIYVPCQSLQAYKTAFGQYYEPRIMCNSGETPSGTTELEIVYETSGANQTNWLFAGAAQPENSYFYQFYSAITLMVIDGVPVEKSPDNIHVSYPRTSDHYFYEFQTAGRHTVKYYLSKDYTPATHLSDLIFADNLGNMHIVEANIGSGFTSLGTGPFQGCSELTAATIPSTVRSMGPYAFEYSGIREITIPDSVTAFTYPDYITSGYGNFNKCSGLTSITIGTGLTSLPRYTFDGCSSLQTVTMNRTTPPTLENYCFKNCTSLAHIYVPAASVNAYKTASGWSDYASIISAKP